MSDPRVRLQRRYEFLLRAYPRSYQSRHGQELLGTLLEASHPGQAIPSVREGAALVVGGARMRALDAADTPQRWWLDGLHLGVSLLALSLLLVRSSGAAQAFSPWWFVLLGLTVATMRGWVMAAAPVAAVLAVLVSRPLLHDALPGWVNSLPVLSPEYGDVSAVAPYVIIAAGLLLLAAASLAGQPHGDPVFQHRAWAWFLVPLLLVALHGSGLTSPQQLSWRLAIAAIETGVLTAALACSVLARDPRWALAAAVYLTPGLMYAVSNGVHTVPALLYTSIVWLLVIASIAAATVPGRAPQAPAAK